MVGILSYSYMHRAFRIISYKRCPIHMGFVYSSTMFAIILVTYSRKFLFGFRMSQSHVRQNKRGNANFGFFPPSEIWYNRNLCSRWIKHTDTNFESSGVDCRNSFLISNCPHFNWTVPMNPIVHWLQSCYVIVSSRDKKMYVRTAMIELD